MKKTSLKILTVLVIFLSLQSLSAQNIEISKIKLGYGLITTNEIALVFETIAAQTIANIDLVNGKNIGSFFLEYKHPISEKLMIGATFAYQTVSHDYQNRSDKTIIGTEKNTFYTFAAEIDYNYIDKTKFQLYSGLGLGYTMLKDSFAYKSGSLSNLSGSSGLFNYHITGLGLSFGEKIGFFLEAGFGYKGIISGGLNFNF